VVGGVFVSSAGENFSKIPIVVNVKTTTYPLYKLPFHAINICLAVNVKKIVGEKLLSRYICLL
jgi:hypothetical protein